MFSTNFSPDLHSLNALPDQSHLADLADGILEGLLVLGLTEGAVLLLLTSIDGLVGGGADVEGVELVVLQLVLVGRGLVASLKSDQICYVRLEKDASHRGEKSAKNSKA